MRKLKIFSLAVTVAVALSCAKDEAEMNTFAVTGLRAESLPGAIELSWDVPTDRNFLYVKVEWQDLATGEDRVKLCSRYTGSLRVDGLLQKYGKYRFTFTAYGADGTVGQPVVVERSCGRAPSYYVEIGENNIILTASMVSTNAQEPSEGPVSNLVDGDPDTFFQSFWDEWTYPELKPAGYHYLAFDFGKEVNAFRFKYWNRKRGGSRPQTVNIYTCNDGETWTFVSKIDNLPSDAGSTYESEVFLFDEPVSNMKFEVVKGTDIYQPFFSLAEISFTEVLRELVDPEAN